MPTIQPTVYSFLLIFTSAIVLMIAFQRWSLIRIRPTAGPGALLMVCGAVWMMTNALELITTDLDTALLWNRLQIVAVVPVPVLWLVLALQFGRFNRTLTQRVALWLSLFGVVTLILTLRGDTIGLIYARTTLKTQNGLSYLNTEYGPWMIAYYLYGYLLVGAGTVILLRRFANRNAAFRRQGLIILIGVILTVAFNLYDLSGAGSQPQIKLTPLGLVIAVPLFIITLTRVRRADILPVARSSVVHVMQDSVIVLDVESRVIDLNPKAESLIGSTLEAAAGKIIQELWPAWADALTSWIFRTRLGVPLATEHTAPSGIFEVRVSPIMDPDGRPISRVIVLRDITERTRAEQALRDSEERYRLHFEHVNDVIFSMDTEMRFVSVTPSVERYLDLRPEDVVGKRITDLDFLLPEYFEKALNEAQRVMRGERSEGIIYEFRSRNGTRLFAEVSGSPIYRDGVVIGSVNLARDISERIRGEERIRASLQEKEVLLKEIHHRVKNNLQIISSLLSLQSSRLPDMNLIAQFQDSQNRIRAMALIHERLYRSEDLAQVDFGDYLRSLTESLTETYQRQNQNIVVSIEAEPVALDIDTAIPCGLLVNELISNVFKHAFPDSRPGLLTVRLAQGAPNELGPHGAPVCLTVQDDGIGLPAGLDVTRTASLGLQLVTSLARQIEATLDVSTQRGTSYTITFTPAGVPGRVPREVPAPAQPA